MFFKEQLFFDNEGGGGGGGDITNLPEVPSPSDADLDVLGGDDEGDESPDEEVVEEEPSEEKPAPKVAAKKTEEKPDEIDEGDEEEEVKPKVKDEVVEDEVPTEGELASIKALKKDYPDIFKKHPQLRVAVAEHRQFREVFSSIDEAKEAVEAQNNLFSLREQILDKSDFGAFLDEVNRVDGAAAARLVRKILPSVLERSKDLYYEITQEPITQFVAAAFNHGRRGGNNNLSNSALHMWKFLGFDGTPAPQATGPSQADREMETRVNEFENRKFADASTMVTRDIRENLTSLIERSIDPKNQIKETIKRATINQLVREIDAEVAADQNHMNRVHRLWQNARRSSYAPGHTSRIISAYLERAKQLLPKHARKVREELGISIESGNGQPQNDERPVQTQGVKKPVPRPMTGGNVQPKTIRDTNPRQIDWDKTSDTDILSGKAKLRRR